VRFDFECSLGYFSSKRSNGLETCGCPSVLVAVYSPQEHNQATLPEQCVARGEVKHNECKATKLVGAFNQRKDFDQHGQMA